MLNDFYLMYSVWRVLLNADKLFFVAFIVLHKKVVFMLMNLFLLSLLHIRQRQLFLHNNSFSSTGSGPGVCVGGTTDGVGERGGQCQRSPGQGSRHGER